MIIDEVSMISAEMFQALEAQARAVKHTERPFGGIQIILSGDFFQCGSCSSLPVPSSTAAAAVARPLPSHLFFLCAPNHLQVAEHDLQRWFAKNCVGFRLIASACKVSTLSQGNSSTSPANLLGLKDRQQGDQKRLCGAAATRILLLAVRRLPPITTRWTPNMGDDAFLNRGFTFQCPAWRTCALQEFLLTKARAP